MSVVSFKTASASASPASAPASPSTGGSSKGGSNAGKYIMWGLVIVGVAYAGWKFIIEPRMKANRENDDD